MRNELAGARSPLTHWQCDVCGELVDRQTGYVIWRRKGHKCWDFKIIHQKQCDDPAYLSSLPIDSFLGPDGLARLTSFLDIGEFHDAPELRSDDDMRVASMPEFVTLLRRLQIPYYEEARTEFSNPLFRQEVDGVSEVSVYKQEVLRRAASGEFGD